MDPSISQPLAAHQFTLSARQILSGFLAAFILMVIWCFNLIFIPAILAIVFYNIMNGHIDPLAMSTIYTTLLVVAVLPIISIPWLLRRILLLKTFSMIFSFIFGITYILFSIQFHNITISGLVFVVFSGVGILLSLMKSNRVESDMIH